MSVSSDSVIEKKVRKSERNKKEKSGDKGEKAFLCEIRGSRAV
jgi:hypothetical protein